MKILYRLFFLIFLILILWALYKSGIVGYEKIKTDHFKYTIILSIFFLIFFIGFYLNKNAKLLILISTISIFTTLYTIELTILYKSKKIQKNKEILYKKITYNEYDKRSLVEYYRDKKREDSDIKVAVYPDRLNKKNNIEIFPLSGIANKKTILCNENGYYVTYTSDRFGFNNLDSEWDKDTIAYLLLGDSLVHGFCVKSENNMTSVLKNISKESVINLSYGGNGPLIQLASLREYKPNKVKKIIWTYSEWNDLIDITFEINNPILNKYYSNKNFSQNLKEKQNLIDDIGNNLIAKNNNLQEQKFINFLKNFIFLNNLRFALSKKTKFYIPEENFKIFEEIITEFINFSYINNSTPYFVYIPSYNTFTDDINEINYLKIKKIVGKLDIKFIDIREEILNERIDIKKLFPYNLPGHYSKEGYKFITNKIYNYIK